MGSSAFKALSPGFYSDRSFRPANCCPTYEFPFQSETKPGTPHFIIFPLHTTNHSTQYAVSLNRLNFTIRIAKCSQSVGEQFVVNDQNVFGIVRNGNGQIYFKKRILRTRDSLTDVLQRFCHRKAMSLLGTGQKIGYLFGVDAELYEGYLQYAGELLVCRKKKFSTRDAEQHRVFNSRVLANYNLAAKYQRQIAHGRNDLLMVYSAGNSRYVYKEGQLANLEGWSQDLLRTEKLPPHNSSCGQLSVLSNPQIDYERLVKDHQFYTKQTLKQRDNVTNVHEYLNKLQNHIYFNNQIAQRQLRKKFQKDLNLSVPTVKNVHTARTYFTCLQHFYQRAGRHTQQGQCIRLLLTLNFSDSELYKQKLSRLLIQQKTQIIVRHSELALNSWHNSFMMGKYYLEKGQLDYAQKSLLKSCQFQQSSMNSAHLQAAELLIEFEIDQKAKDFLIKGIKKQSKSSGTMSLLTFKLYNTLGKVFTVRHQFKKALQSFQYARSIYKLRKIIAEQYFICLSNIVYVLDKLKQYDQGFQIFKEVQSLTHYTSTIEPHNSIVLYSNLGNLLFNSCRYDQARISLSRCTQYPTGWNTLSDQSYIRMFVNLACMQIKQKNAVNAQLYFKYATDRQRCVNLSTIKWTAYHLHNSLGIFHFKKGEYRKALNQFQRLIQWLQDLQQYPCLEQTKVHLYYNIASTYKKVHRTDQALYYYKSSQTISNKLYGYDHPFSEVIGIDIEQINKYRIQQLSSQLEQSNRQSVARVQMALPQQMPREGNYIYVRQY